MEQPPLRTAVRSLIRDRILDAAESLMVQHTWNNVRMVDIATAAGVSRRTVFNEFGTKDAVLEGVSYRNTLRIGAGALARADQHPNSLADAVASAVEYTLRTTSDDPVFRVTVIERASEPDALLSVLTTKSGPVIEVGAGLAVAELKKRWPDIDVDDDKIRFVSDSILRVVLSHIVSPTNAPVSEVACAIGWMAERVLLG